MLSETSKLPATVNDPHLLSSLNSRIGPKYAAFSSPGAAVATFTHRAKTWLPPCAQSCCSVSSRALWDAFNSHCLSSVLQPYCSSWRARAGTCLWGWGTLITCTPPSVQGPFQSFIDRRRAAACAQPMLLVVCASRGKDSVRSKFKIVRICYNARGRGVSLSLFSASFPAAAAQITGDGCKQQSSPSSIMNERQK